MKLRVCNVIFFCGLLFGSAFVACSKKAEPDPKEVNQVVDKFQVPVRAVNDWITSNMREIYYWNTSIPADKDLKKGELQPDVFFDGVLYEKDRFSWIEEADKLVSDLSGISTTVGMGIQLIALSDNTVIISVAYTHKGSPAEQAGLKRGDILTRINGNSMNTSNYQTMMAPYYGDKSFSVRLAQINGSTLNEGKEVQLTPVSKFQESAILKDTVLTTPSGKKVAYLFYNRFLNEQINELIAVFNKFKQAQVDELILDMRYNGGGSIFVSGVLSSLIYKGFNENDVFVKYKYNSNYRAEDYSFYRLFGGLSKDQEEKDNADVIVGLVKMLNLGLDRVFTLATNRSASATELVMNNLRPYMSNTKVVHIGAKTVGKNQGSITVLDESKPRVIHWGMQPIVVLLANKNGEGDYYEGLQPHYTVNENSSLPFKPLGDSGDPLVSKALSIIDPTMVARYETQMRVGQKQSEGIGVRTDVSLDDAKRNVRTVELGNTLKY